MKRPRKPSRTRPSRRQTSDRELAPYHVDWTTEASFDVDPVLIENIRARQALRQITLRIGAEQIAEASRAARLSGVPYRTVLRRWLAGGASRSRALRKAG